MPAASKFYPSGLFLHPPPPKKSTLGWTHQVRHFAKKHSVFHPADEATMTDKLLNERELNFQLYEMLDTEAPVPSV